MRNWYLSIFGRVELFAEWDQSKLRSRWQYSREPGEFEVWAGPFHLIVNKVPQGRGELRYGSNHAEQTGPGD